MTSQERVLTSLSHAEPDRVPVDFWASTETFTMLQQALGLEDKEAVLKRFNVDLRYFNGPPLKAGNELSPEPGIVVDHWGVRRKSSTIHGTRRDGTSYTWTYKHMERSPLAQANTVTDVEKHAWPTADLWDFSGAREACLKLKASGCAVVAGADRLDRTAQLKPAMYIRGTENFMSDLVLDEEVAEAILTHISDYYLEYNRQLFDAICGVGPDGRRGQCPIDIFFMGDDMGTQNSTWVSIPMYRRFFKKRLAAYCDLAHRYGMKTMYHTCGNITTLVGDFVDAGLDILQSLQPAAIGNEKMAWIKKQYGRDLCFQGGVDIQQVMPRGTPDEVRAHVRERRSILADGGGYIFGTAHNVLPDVPLENILALIETYQEPLAN